MWHTSYGDRTLNKAEAAVFLEAVAYMRDMISVAVDLRESHVFGVPAFDGLQPTQQMAALHTVATALLKPEVEAPTLCATLEATIYAVYRELLALVEIEIDHCRLSGMHAEQSSGDDSMRECFQFSNEIRQAVLTARLAEVSSSDWHSSRDADFSSLPENTSEDVAAWEREIEILANQVLWDRDFELEGLIADQDPMQVEAVKSYLGISNDYFATAAPDAASSEYLRLDAELVELRNLSPTLFEGGDEFTGGDNFSRRNELPDF